MLFTEVIELLSADHIYLYFPLIICVIKLFLLSCSHFCLFFFFVLGFQMSNPFIYDTGKRSPYGCLGHEVQIEHIKAYVCRPSFFTDKAVIVIHDVFGWQFPDIRYIVDLIAGHGYM